MRYKILFLCSTLLIAQSLHSINLAAEITEKSIAATEVNLEGQKPEEKGTGSEIHRPDEQAELPVIELPAFDLNLKLLPPSYPGHDIKKIVSALISRSLDKQDDFETSLQYKERLKEELTKPLVGTLKIDDILAATIKGKYKSILTEGFNVKYIADAEKYFVDLYISEFHSNDPSSYVGIVDGLTISSDTNVSDGYAATNAFGAAVQVQNGTTQEYNLVFNNLYEWGFEKGIYGPYHIGGNFSFPADRAKYIMYKIALAVIYKLDRPFYRSDFYRTRATFSDPMNYVKRSHYVYAKVLGMWVFNYETGEVLIRFTRKNNY